MFDRRPIEHGECDANRRALHVVNPWVIGHRPSNDSAMLTGEPDQCAIQRLRDAIGGNKPGPRAFRRRDKQ